MTHDEKSLRIKNIALKHNSESLIKEIQKLSLENDKLYLEKLFSEKKLKEQYEKCLHLEKVHSFCMKVASESEEKIRNLENELDSMNISRGRLSNTLNIKKIISGGKHLRQSTMLSKISEEGIQLRQSQTLSKIQEEKNNSRQSRMFDKMPEEKNNPRQSRMFDKISEEKNNPRQSRMFDKISE